MANEFMRIGHEASLEDLVALTAEIYYKLPKSSDDPDVLWAEREFLLAAYREAPEGIVDEKDPELWRGYVEERFNQLTGQPFELVPGETDWSRLVRFIPQVFGFDPSMERVKRTDEQEILAIIEHRRGVTMANLG